MNRIDLHIHTQKCKDGDGSSRNITVDNFINVMHENFIKVCAITNHNKFDKLEYSTICDKDPDLVIFPGIELDVKFENDDNRHIILICDPKQKANFYQTFDNDPSRDYDEYKLLYDEFIQKIKLFNTNEIIIIPHFLDKDKKRSLNEYDKNLLKKTLIDYVVILETAKLKSMGIVNAHNEVSLIGSDIKDWNDYNEESLKLPELKFPINSFGTFYELTSNPKVFIKSELNGCHKYEVCVNKNKSDEKVEIYDDINVIFGEKGSGKTYFLENFLYPFLQQKGKEVILHNSKDYQTSYNSMIDSIKNMVNIDLEIKNNIISKLGKIFQYHEQPITNFIDMYIEFHKNEEAGVNAKLIQKTNASYNKNSFKLINEIIENEEKKILKINQTKIINDECRDSSDLNRLYLNEALNRLSNEIIEKAIDLCNTKFIISNTDKMLTSIKKIIQKKTGKKSKPNNIGFTSLVASRLNRIKNNSEIIESLISLKTKKNIPIGELPNKGKITASIEIKVLSPNEKYNTDSVFGKSSIRANRELIKKLLTFSVEDFTKINKYFENEKEKDPDIYIEEIIKKSCNIIRNDGNLYNPSEGEKAILAISGILENNSYDCYLFDEIERGLGNKYISRYLIPRLKQLRDVGKLIVLSTHNANIAINTLPSQTIYCNYIDDTNKNIYYSGNMYSNELIGVTGLDGLDWEEKAIIHLEGSEKMFNTRRNIYGC